jgi:SAM-dependent methyltransferase
VDLKEENAISGDPSAHWYYISKGRAIKALLGRQPIEELLDVGAGSGVFSKMLVNEGCVAKATCFDPNYADEFIGKRRTDKVAYVRNIDAVEADTVLMIDVIEHVDDDVGMLRDYVRRAEPGTRFLISVPAFQSLWSSHDVFLERRRRYRLSDLRRTVEASGLTPLRMRYFFGLLFPAAAAMRLAEKNNQNDAPTSQLKSAPDWLNKSLIALHKLECAALLPLNKFAGVTAFCLAEKPRALAQEQKAA